jgi:hypothetical protein
MSDPEKRGQEPAIMGLVQLPINTSEDVSEEETTTKEAATKVMESVQDENAEHLSELQPHLHARTFLAVFAVCLIYFAQLFSIVGAGTVSFVFLCEHQPQRKVQLQEVTQLLILVPRLARRDHRRQLPSDRGRRVDHRSNSHPHGRPWSHSLTGGRLLGPEMVSGDTHTVRSCRRGSGCSRFEHGHDHRWIQYYRHRLRCAASHSHSGFRGPAPALASLGPSQRHDRQQLGPYHRHLCWWRAEPTWKSQWI